MSSKLTVSGELPCGVEIDGVVHRTFTLRAPKLQDNIDAIDEVGASNNLALSAAILARQIVALGTLKPEQITFDLLADMDVEDFNAIDAKASELEKKRKAAVVAARGSSASASPSAAPA